MNTAAKGDEMNAERLLRLADHLDTVPPELFDLAHWGSRVPCGTVCCAVGHACLMPEFQAAGFRAVWDEDGFEPEFSGLTDWDATELFFGIGHVTALCLFSAQSYPVGAPATAAQVAARIRAFVRSNWEDT